MKKIIALLLMARVRGDCAAGGIAEAGLEYGVCSICDPTLFAAGSTELVIEEEVDRDTFPNFYANFGIKTVTPGDGTCTITGYDFSKTPGTFDPYIHKVNSSPDANTPIRRNNPTENFNGVQHIRLYYYNADPREIIFYVCAIFNDASKYCHPQRVRLYITCKPSYKYTTSQAMKQFIFPQQPLSTINFATDVQSIFQIDPAAHSNCHLTEYEVFSDSACTTPFVSDATYTLTDLTDITKTKLTVVSTSSINHKKLFVRVKSPFTTVNSDVLELNIHVCGYENIVANVAVTTITAVYDYSIGTQTKTHVYAVSSTSLQSDQAGCPIIGYKLVDAALNDITGTQFTVKPFGIDVDTSIPFHNQPMFLRAYTSGNQIYDVPVSILVCGGENVLPSSTISPIQATFVKNQGTKTVSHTAMTSLLYSDISQCPIINYKLVDAAKNDVSGTQFSVSGGNINVDTSTSFNQPMYLRAYTKANKFYDIPVNIVVCGDENILATEPLSIKATYEKDIGIQLIDVSQSIFSKLSSSVQGCPIVKYQIFNLDKTNPYNDPKLEIELDQSTLKINTFYGSDFSAFLRAETQSSTNYYFVPIDIEFCGKEVIQEIKPIKISLRYERTVVPQRHNITEETQYLKSTITECPIRSYSLVTADGKEHAYWGPSIYLYDDQLLIHAHQVTKESVYLMAKTKSGVKHMVNVNIEVYQNQSTVKYNRAPQFMSQLPTKVQLNQSLLNLTLPEIYDEYDQFYCMQISSESLGQPSEYKNITMMREFNGTETDSIMPFRNTNRASIIKYDGFSNSIEFEIPIDQRTDYVGEHLINFKLFDVQGLHRDYIQKFCFVNETHSDCPIVYRQEKTQSSNHTSAVSIPQPQRPTNPLWANITSLNETGLMTINFRDYMQTQKFGQFNVTELARYFNNETFSIYVIRSDPNDELMYYNLSFYCVKYYEDEMQIQIDFEHPLWISQDESRDILHVYLVNHTYFRSNYTRSPNWLKWQSVWERRRRLEEIKPQPNYTEEFQDLFNLEDIDSMYDEEGREYEFVLSLNYTNLRVRIPKQLPEPMRPYVSINRFWLTVFLVMTFFAFLHGFIFIRICWILLIAACLSLQVVAHLPLLKVVIPANGIIAFQDIIPIASFDWLGFDFYRTRWFAKMLFSFDEFKHDELEDQILFAQPRDLGWNRHCLVLILGSYFTFWTLYFFRMLYIGAFKFLLIYLRHRGAIDYSRYRKLEKYQIQKKNRVFWSNFIMIFLISLYEILIGGVLNFKVTLRSSSGDGFSALFTTFLFIIITLMLVPRMTYYIMTQELMAFQKDKKTRLALTERHYWFQRKFSAFWWRQPKRNKCQIGYSVVFMLRRVVFVWLVFKTEFWLQIMATLYMNFGISIYYTEYKPKKQRLEYRMELFNEIMIYVITYHLLLFSDWVQDPETKYFYGWSIWINILFMILVNCLVIGYFAVKYSIILGKKLIQWAQIMRYLMNLKYNHYRKKSMEEEPHVSFFHVVVRKLLFKIKFFKEEQKYQEEEKEEEYIEAVDDCVQEINTMKFGFAYTYPYKIDNQLPPAKSELQAKIRQGYPNAQPLQQQPPKQPHLERVEPDLLVFQSFKDLLQQQDEQQTPQLVDVKPPSARQILKTDESITNKIKLLFDYNKIVKMVKPQMATVKDEFDYFKGRNLKPTEPTPTIPTIVDQERAQSEMMIIEYQEEPVEPKFVPPISSIAQGYLKELDDIKLPTDQDLKIKKVRLQEPELEDQEDSKSSFNQDDPMSLYFSQNIPARHIKNKVSQQKPNLPIIPSIQSNQIFTPNRIYKSSNLFRDTARSIVQSQGSQSMESERIPQRPDVIE